MAAALHVSISAETIYQIGDFAITNSMFTGTLVSAFLLLLFVLGNSQIKNTKTISRFQALIEVIIESMFNLTKDIAGDKKARDFFPLIATSIIFIAVNNWAGLLPGVGTIGIDYDPTESGSHAQLNAIQAHAADEVIAQEIHSEDDVILDVDEYGAEVTSIEDSSEEGYHIFIPLFRAATADINTTLALALISVFLTQVYGVKYLGLGYFTKFLNFKDGPIFTFVGLLEIISEFAKIISFAFRLFGNIFAGEVLLAVIAWLVPVLAPIPFIGLEIFVGFVQALVFAMLTLVFINMATISHDH